MLASGFPPAIPKVLVRNGSAPLDVSGPSDPRRTYLIYPVGETTDTKRV